MFQDQILIAEETHLVSLGSLMKLPNHIQLPNECWMWFQLRFHLFTQPELAAASGGHLLQGFGELLHLLANLLTHGVGVA